MANERARTLGEYEQVSDYRSMTTIGSALVYSVKVGA